MYTPAYRVLVSSEFTEGSFIPRQTGIVCASGQTTWTPECQVLVSSKFREGSFIPRQTGIACAGEQQTRVTSAYLATLQTRPNPSTVGLPAPPPTAPCACAPPAASPPARMPCRRPPARHFPHRCPTQPQCPACVRSLPMRPTPHRVITSVRVKVEGIHREFPWCAPGTLLIQCRLHKTKKHTRVKFKFRNALSGQT